jgi:putative ubiquitin-RnfH superfamily antitoxin RatB of RatAB toxin-antitoxin module
VAAERILVEVAYARPDRQVILSLEASAGITAEQAILRSGILDEFPEIDLDAQKIGIFGKVAGRDAVLNDGDRVEVYRALIADPKEARRKRAAEGKGLKNRAARAAGPGGESPGGAQ